MFLCICCCCNAFDVNGAAGGLICAVAAAMLFSSGLARQLQHAAHTYSKFAVIRKHIANIQRKGTNHPLMLRLLLLLLQVAQQYPEWAIRCMTLLEAGAR
jgi:hypothetical protein